MRSALLVIYLRAAKRAKYVVCCYEPESREEENYYIYYIYVYRRHVAVENTYVLLYMMQFMTELAN